MRYFKVKRNPKRPPGETGRRPRLVHATMGIFRFSNEEPFESICGKMFRPVDVAWTTWGGWKKGQQCPECANLREPLLVSDVLMEDRP
jgi:hypothetical protein